MIRQSLCHAQLELRDLRSRTKVQERRRPSDLVEVVRLEGRPFQFLYKDEGALTTVRPIFASMQVPLRLLQVLQKCSSRHNDDSSARFAGHCSALPAAASNAWLKCIGIGSEGLCPLKAQ